MIVSTTVSSVTGRMDVNIKALGTNVLVAVGLDQRWTESLLGQTAKPSHYAVYSQPPMSTQPSIPPGQVIRLPAPLAGVKVGYVHLCRLACDRIWL